MKQDKYNIRNSAKELNNMRMRETAKILTPEELDYFLTELIDYQQLISEEKEKNEDST